MADVHSQLADVIDLVTAARSMPLSSSCIIDRAALLAALQNLDELLPSELSKARDVISGREDVVEDGRREADQIIATARQERARLISRSEVAQAAAKEADRVLSEAHANAEATRADVDDYVDTKLANFEVVLQRTIQAVEKGREKLRGRQVHHQLADDEPLPE